ncbi:MAG: leucyl/phenylalanyl-tRNA--protein transferase [Limisphaerales bacterium]
MAAPSEPLFPDPRRAPRRGPQAGLVAVGGDLTVPRLLAAYRAGVFPWSAAPVTWWSPDPRGVFELTGDGLHLPRSLARVLRQVRFTVTVNREFQAVVEGCARQPRPGSWISPAFITAYSALHAAGHAHSVEVWRGGALAGGLYGVAAGGLFAGESMFHMESDASKVAVVATHRHLRECGFRLFDIQMLTPTTAALGAVEIPRDEYLDRLAEALRAECRFA